VYVLNKIVDTGLKVDLHIHSALSNHKDGAKVGFNTIGNIRTLIEKLAENEVNVCAITDHDAFDYNLYKTLKREEQEDNSIKKVLPGVEFSVQFDNNSETKVIHIVTIFNDINEEKVKKIENILKLTNNKPNYDTSESAFTEEKYLSLLRQIDVDTIMIAHQKNSLTSTGKAIKCDAASLGSEKFNEFLFTEYFEAYEFRNKKNEIFNKNYIFNNNVEDELRFITGSDCHNWNAYPNEDLNSAKEFSFTYVKCLPAFKGLVMATTDHRRIKLVNSFFDPSAYSIDKIDIETNGKNIQIPLSKGLNVIIGDNSIGKSLLLHEITDYNKPCPSAMKKV
jgi:hypothetical protein